MHVWRVARFAQCRCTCTAGRCTSTADISYAGSRRKAITKTIPMIATLSKWISSNVTPPDPLTNRRFRRPHRLRTMRHTRRPSRMRTEGATQRPFRRPRVTCQAPHRVGAVMSRHGYESVPTTRCSPDATGNRVSHAFAPTLIEQQAKFRDWNCGFGCRFGRSPDRHPHILSQLRRRRPLEATLSRPAP